MNSDSNPPEKQPRRNRWKPFFRAVTFYVYNSFVTHFPLYGMRHWYLRHVLGIPIGANASVHMGCFFTGRNIRIGRDTVINRNTYLDGRGGLSIGSYVAISPESYIISLDHDPNSASFEAFPDPVRIEDYAWIGARAMVLPGVTLGKGCVVGAGSVVTRDVADFSIVAGVPSKVIGRRSGRMEYSPRYTPYFNTDVLP
jgi:acetyltransferase-like isoleucine patch superfamily enzyme